MKRLQLNLELTSIIVILAIGVLLPVMLSTAAGIVALVIAKDVGGIVTGVLVVSFAVTAMGSALATVALTGRKARLARRQADFVANISHELRTPLSAIRLYTQTLQAGKLDNDPQQTSACLATILRETEWLDVMIDSVLTWRASSKDMLPLDMRARPVANAVNKAIERFRNMVPPEEMHFTASVDSSLPVLHDSRALGVIVLNLLTNAYKYTGEDKRIRVEAQDQGNEVLITVSDNGRGLNAKQSKRIFQAFYRVDFDAGSDSGGTGLGLAIVQYLVRRHKGHISVTSAPGQGATFTVRLPGGHHT